MPKLNRTFIARTLSVLLCLPLISSCDWETKTKISPQFIANSISPDCFGTHCGAFDSSTFSGRDYGVWTFANNSAVSTQVPVSISGTDGFDLMLIFTNRTNANQPMTSIQLSPDQLRVGPHATRLAQQNRADTAHSKRLAMSEKSAARLKNLNPTPIREQTVRAPSTVGTHRNWWIHMTDPPEPRAATLIQQATASDGRLINIWVEDTEYVAGKITPAIVDELIRKFVTGLDTNGDYVAKPGYDAVKEIVGAPWGPHSRTDLITDNNEMDIVLANLEPDGALGESGYFYNLNNFISAPTADDPELAYSNESISFYLDTENVYLRTEGPQYQLTVLHHEMTHMANFYNRYVVMGAEYGFDRSLEEMSGMMMQDLSFYLDEYAALIFRYRDWLYDGDLNCSYFEWNPDWTGSCYSYSRMGVLGSYLLRHYGLDFFRQLLREPSTKSAGPALEFTLKKYAGHNIADVIPRVVSNIALMNSWISPNYYGIPFTTNSGYQLPSLGGPSEAGYRILPNTVPTELKPYSSFPVMRNELVGDYQETVTVPPNTTLTIIVK